MEIIPVRQAIDRIFRVTEMSALPREKPERKQRIPIQTGKRRLQQSVSRQDRETRERSVPARETGIIMPAPGREEGR
jgi:hypothetical protein